MYSTLYANQAFDTSGDVGSRKGPGSHSGSGVVYVYDGVTGTLLHHHCNLLVVVVVVVPSAKADPGGTGGTCPPLASLTV